MRRLVVAGAGVAAGVLLIASAPAGAAEPRVVVKPKPGQQVTHHPVRLVVRAGPETTDLSARLNGKRIGRDFAVRRRGIRELNVSNNHGLRHGRNVLEVVAHTRRGTRVRRSTVRFTVAHKRPLVGAGRDRRAAVGNRIELNGRVVEHPRGNRADRVRWKVVHAPRGSQLRARSLKRASARQRLLRRMDTRSPSFKPDVNGTYTLRMTAGKGDASTTDLVDLHGVPETPTIELHTRPDAKDVPSGRPAIQVGSNVYLAPFLGEEEGGRYFDASHQIAEYTSYFQAVVLDRTTLELVANRTYGICERASYTCRMNGDGEQVKVNIGQDLAGFGSDRLVILSSAPARGGLFCCIVREALENLDAIGFPRGDELAPLTQSGAPEIFRQLTEAPADSLSVIGVPGMKPGDADWAVIPEAVYPPARGMNGYLMPDQNSPHRYQFVPSARVPFDTRSKSLTCDDENGTCTVAASLGDEQMITTGPQDAFWAGFQVAVFDSHTLEPKDRQFFVTNTNSEIVQSDPPFRYAPAMTGFLRQHGEAGDVILVTSQRIGKTTQSKVLAGTGPDAEGFSQAEWDALARQITSVGGTLHGFNSASSTPGSDYTLIGFGGADEGGGRESVGTDARLRGVLVQDHESRYRPSNVSEAGAPSELLMSLMMQAPGTQPWPYADDAGVNAAIAWIGRKFSALGADPRRAYWTQEIGAGDPAQATTLSDEISRCGTSTQCPEPTDAGFTHDDFVKARDQLATELDYVAQVRTYLDHLAAPSGGTAGDAWPEIITLTDGLNKSLDDVKARSDRQITVDRILSDILHVASFYAGFGGIEELAKFLHAVSVGLELSNQSLEALQDGSDPDDRKVAVDEVAQHLHDRMQQLADGYSTIGDVLVSDWAKLSVVGQYGDCNQSQRQCPPGFEELAFSPPRDARPLTTLSLKRSIHQIVMPFYYPIMDTGTSWSCPGDSHGAPPDPPCNPDAGPDPFSQTTTAGEPSGGFVCAYGDKLDPPPNGNPTPFGDGYTNAPKQAYASSLEAVDPTRLETGTPGSANLWRTFLATTQVGDTWGWPPAEILTYMFTPADLTDPANSKGLGISAADWMREAHLDEVPPPGLHCSWFDRF